MINRVKLTSPYVESFLNFSKTLNFEERETLLIEPGVVSEFSCSACGECCQRPWAISVFQDYYEKWAPILENHPSGRFADAFTVYKEPSSLKYANINRKPYANECIFLDDDRKCFIQKNYGEEALSHVCKTYPRYEQWQGAFLGKFLASGCPDVAQLLLENPDIYAEKVRLSLPAWQNLKQRSHPLGFQNAYTWTGLTLDIASDLRYTPTQNVLRINQVLKHLHTQALDQITPEHLCAIGQQASKGELSFNESRDREGGHQLLLRLSPSLPLLHNYLMRIDHGEIPVPRITTAEREYMNAFMQRYLMYRMLTARIDFSMKFARFFKTYFHISLQMVFLQWLALCYRDRDQEPLNMHHLARAFAQIGYRLENAREALSTEEAEQTSVLSLLESIDMLLSGDLGQSPQAV